MFSAGTHTGKLVKNATAGVKLIFFNEQFFSRGKDDVCRNSVLESVNASYVSNQMANWPLLYKVIKWFC